MFQSMWRFTACLTIGLLLVQSIPLDRTKPPKSNSKPVFGDGWKDCGEGATDMTVNNVIVLPHPVVPGKNFSLDLDCQNSVELSGGSFITQVYLAGVQVHTETDDLCDIHPCPIPTGAVRLGTRTYMPIITPPGLYEVKVTGLDADGLPVICAEIHFTVL